MKLAGLVFAVVLAIVPAAVAQNAPAAPDAKGRIAGRVVAADSGRPLRGAIVQAIRWGTPGRQARTDANGHYEFTGLDAGEYLLTAQAPRYLQMEFGGSYFDGRYRARPIVLGETTEFTRADFLLPRGGAIEGRLLDEFGDPAPGLVIQVAQVEYAGGRRRLMPRGNRAVAPRTDDRGYFRVHGLAPGSYYLSALSGAFADQAETGGFAPTYYPGTPDVAAAKPVRLELGQQLTLTFPLTPARMSRISGRLVGSSGKPVRGSVFLSTADSLGVSEFFITRGETDERGAFVFRNVPPGRFTLQGYGGPVVQGPGNLAAVEFGWLPLVVEEQDQADLELRVAAGPSLKGRVSTDDTQGAPFNPRDVSVTAQPVQYDSGPVGGGPPPFTMNDDGTFEVHNMSGTRMIRVSVRNPRWMLKRITRLGRDITDEPIVFDKTDVDGVEVLLTNRVTALEGTVTDENGKPVPDYAVIVFAADRSKWTDRSRFIATARPNQSGQFRIAALPPEDYFVIALRGVQGNAWQDPDYLRTLEDAATRFLLGDGETKTLTLRLVTSR